MPAPLFNEILENNQLIKGRLNVNRGDLEKLYQALQKDSDRLKRKQIRQEEIIQSTLVNRNEIKVKIKRNFESIQKSFHPSSEKISLLYKKMGDAFYIKARFYWEGKQREVQVGSIPIVLEIINTMISNNMLDGLKPIRAKRLTWNEIKRRANLIIGIKKIASLKSQEYILRKLMLERLNLLESKDTVIKEENKTSEIIKENSSSPTKYKTESDKVKDLEDGDNWYDKWRKENL
ncbi:MAG: hypothetical protein H8E85_05660 [Candidatus Marinimicrobia bacterium]|nr:hypothetical protein [Candidatus Neomarinimicrobiota bacterium]